MKVYETNQKSTSQNLGENQIAVQILNAECSSSTKIYTLVAVK